ncbi:MAG: dihydrodipicolinate synthase family protein, partial [bacterium]
MKKIKKYHGVVIPMITPFTESGRLDEEAAIRITDHVVEAGTYPFLLGTTGESASIPLETRFQLVKCVTKHLKNRSFIYAGISNNCFEHSITTAKSYHDLGVNALVAHLPSYYPLIPDHILKYFELLAERSPGPIVIYNILGTTHMSIPLTVVE